MVGVQFLRRPFENGGFGFTLLPKQMWGTTSGSAYRMQDSDDSGPEREASADALSDDTEDLELQRALEASADLQNEVESRRAEAIERLKSVADRYKATVHPVQADGNCQFRALAFDLYGSEDGHEQLRAAVIAQLKATPQRYQEFVHEPYSEYIARMERQGQWGDNVTLQAASDVLCCMIRVFTDRLGDDAGECILVHPAQTDATEGLLTKPLWSVQKTLSVAFTTEVHYDAAPVQRVPPIIGL
jgi:hypothetical protein